jgi:hypothetical protein
MAETCASCLCLFRPIAVSLGLAATAGIYFGLGTSYLIPAGDPKIAPT